MINYSSRLLNYVESFLVGGFNKTAFFTEVNTNIKVGDRIFLLNGNYDSNEFIQNGIYEKRVDGYRVLFVDRCKIVLDIDYSGVLPYNQDIIDNFIKVYNIRSQREFDYINKIIINDVRSIFEKNYSNNIIFTPNSYNPITSGFGKNNGVIVSGFFNCELVGTQNQWSTVTSNFNLNTLSVSNNNGRIYIVGEDFEYNGTVFKQRTVYEYVDGNWVIDIKYKPTILSKLNFRSGVFNGSFNDGIYGTFMKNLKWDGIGSWNSGILVNSDWNSGTLNSKSNISEQSYYSSIGLNFGLTSAFQTTDFSNNKGFGYNYILDSNMNSGYLSNGNYENCNIGVATFSKSINNYYDNINPYNLQALGGFYKFCDVNSIGMSNSSILDCIVDNSLIGNTKLLNSQINNTVAISSEFDSSNGVNIISADMCSYIPRDIISGTSSDIRGVLKLYISELDYLRFDKFDNFFINKINKEYVINSLNSDQKILLPYETRYILDSYFNSELSNNEIVVSIKNRVENEFMPIVFATSSTSPVTNTFDQGKFEPSIDIDLGNYLMVYTDYTSTGDELNYYYNQNIVTKNNVNSLFINTIISNSDFNSGLLTKSKWTSGSNVNYTQNIIKYNNFNTLSMIINGTNSIYVDLENSVTNIYDNYLSPTDTIWLESIDYKNGTQSVDISGRYIIDSVYTSLLPNSKLFKIIDTSNKISGLTFGGTFSVTNSPNYVSVNKFLIENSIIESGLFRRTGFTSSTFINNTFNNNDINLTLNNINKLRLINIISKDNDLIFKNGLFYKSHYINGTWDGGIVYNSIWNGGNFNNGIFKTSYWISGTFSNGLFTESDNQLLDKDYFINIPPVYIRWETGVFDNGIFEKSKWIDGIFNNGKLHTSSFNKGIWNNGVLGDKNIPSSKTIMANEFGSVVNWFNGVVENAIVGGSGSITWYGGKFNSGVFTSGITSSTWLNGDFNGGSFTGNAKWVNGNFNNGGFESYYGYNLINTTSIGLSSSYSWENGKFNNGKFGTGDVSIGLTNSNWFDGEFNGGIFVGRVWNKGILSNGQFIGSGSQSIFNNVDGFVNSFTSSSYYGLWKDGLVLDRKDLGKPNEKIDTTLVRSVDLKRDDKNVSIKNALWVSGTFSHSGGIMDKSVWLNGTFKNGKFTNSSFNPYVNRTLTGATALSFNTSNSCVWEYGYFDGGIFSISEWKDGIFNSGSMIGGIWRNGTWNNGYAENVYWENGTWKNGTWNGTPYDILSIATASNTVKGVAKEIILNIDKVNTHFEPIGLSVITGGDFSTSSVWTDDDYSDDTRPIFYISSGVAIFLSDVEGESRSMGYTGPGLLTNTEYNVTYTLNEVIGSSFNISMGGNNGTFRSYPGTFTDIINSDNGIFSLNATSYSDISKVSIDNISVKLNTTVTAKKIHLINQFQSGRGNLSNVLEDVNIKNYKNFGFGNIGLTSSTFDNTSWRFDLPIIGVQQWFTDPGYDTNSTWVSDPNITIGLDTVTASNLYAVVKNGVNGVTKNVFEFGHIYNIEMKIGVRGNGLLQNVNTYFNIGSQTYSINLTSATSSPYKTRVYTQNFTYTPTLSDISSVNGTKLFINRDPVAVSGGRLALLNAKVVKTRNLVYGDHNNTLYSGVTGLTVSLPGVSTYTAIPDVYGSNNFAYGSDNFNSRKTVSMNFGNGVFKSGVWEKGTWKNGWRSTWASNKDIFEFTTINSIKFSQKVWRILLTPRDLADLEVFKSGDSVSVGNIVIIDYNESRIFIKDRLLVVSSNSSDGYIVLEFKTNLSNIKDILIDSDKHHISITKNIWLNGTFLNGFFKGVWSDGLFDGYPHTAKMESTSWIDGIFRGGHFKTYGANSFGYGANTFGNRVSGLMQNVVLFDSNVGDPSILKYDLITSSHSNIWPYNKNNSSVDNDFNRINLKYDTWIDVNYFTSSMTNIGDKSVSFNAPLETTNGTVQIPIEYNPIHINGYPTYDVLSSETTLRNLYDVNKSSYRLGSKYTKYTDFIGDDSIFNKSIYTEDTPGPSKFIEGGWTYSNILGTVSYRSNFHSLDGSVDNNNQLYLNGGTTTNGTSSYSLLTNIRTNDIERERYSVVEFEYGYDFGLINHVNDPSLDYPNDSGNVFLLNAPNNISLNKNTISHISTSESIKSEFFYNRQSLSMVNYVVGTSQLIPVNIGDLSRPFYMDYSFKRINFYEIDMIPFLQYATESNINSSIKLPK